MYAPLPKHSLVALLYCSIVLICSCGKRTASNTIDTSPYESLVNAYSPRYISVADPIILDFRQDIPVDESALAQIITIKPSVKGQFALSNPRRIVFTPETILSRDTEYTVRVNANRLFKDEQAKNLDFSFHTKPLKLDIDINPLAADNENGWYVAGVINSNDHISKEEIIKTLKIKSDLKIDWQQTAQTRSFPFSITQINRTEKPQSLVLEWHAGKLDKNFVGRHTIEIPAIGSFEILDVQVLNTQTPQILVSFSDILDNRQDLKGLVKIANQADPNVHIDGSQMRVYPTDDSSLEIALTINNKIANKNANTLQGNTSFLLTVQAQHPGVKLMGHGTLVSSQMPYTVAFEAINLHAVDIEIFKIFNNNVLQFLQNYPINEGSYLEQVGRVVHTERVDLGGSSAVKFNAWSRYAVDLSKYLSQDPGAIYQLRIGFRPEYSLFPCEQTTGYTPPPAGQSFMRYIYDYSGYSYLHENNPCYGAFYHMNRFASRNIVITDIATTIKSGKDNKYAVTVNDLNTALPVNGASVTFYDYQQQVISTQTLSSTGMAIVRTDRKASFAIVKHNNSYNYVRLEDYEALSMTDFNISGRSRDDLIDGFIYTDRGVYRPGDTVFVHFMLDDPEKLLPTNHPVNLIITDPRGTERARKHSASSIDGIYSFDIPTLSSDLTGLWNLKMEVGPHHFYHNLRVETIKPNKIKIDIDLPSEIKAGDPKTQMLTLQADWLYGAPANGLRAQVNATINSRATSFPSYSNFIFTDPSRSYFPSLMNLFDNKLDETGSARIPFSQKSDIKSPGKLSASLSTTVFERGGEFSEHFSRVDISPYTHYVGVQLPENKWGSKYFDKDQKSPTARITILDESGKPAANRRLSIGVYDIYWSWWYYENERYNLYNLSADNHASAVWTTTVSSNVQGTVDAVMDFSQMGYGRKMIRICDIQSGHCTGDFFYLSSWNEAIVEDERNSINKIQLNTDKSNYQVGEEVTIKIPSEAGNQVLISIENGREVIMQDWIKSSDDHTTYRFKVNTAMTPNIYIHASLIQSVQKKNNLPMRMYGVASIKVEDPKKKVLPTIKTDTEYSPNKPFTIEVSEASNQDMTYTVAIVDEGLLSLTNFKTPSPYDHFNAKQSLGIKTWDVYDHVAQGAGEGFGQIISVGGDSDVESASGDKQAMRFRPVVMTAGPFQLNRGKTRQHSFSMPNYFGEVRIMIVAKNNNAYGQAEEKVKVRDPLMLYATIPRVLSIGEKINIPVNLIATQDRIGRGNLTLETNGLLSVDKAISSSFTLDRIGESVSMLTAQVGNETGIAKAQVRGTAGNNQAYHELELDVRNPMPQRKNITSGLVKPHASWQEMVQYFGTRGTNQSILELSTMPALQLSAHIDYLISYPYGCLEQITSTGFTQIYLDKLSYLPNDKLRSIRNNVNQAINSIQKLQMSSGAFSYWPGGGSNTYASVYAANFLLEARDAGYVVSTTALDKWIKYESSEANKFRVSSPINRNAEFITHAYRLFVLALAGKQNLAAMNLLRVEDKLPQTARFLLAAAYARSGNKVLAYEMIKAQSTQVNDSYINDPISFGSTLRDKSFIARAALDTDRSEDGFVLVNEIITELNKDTWHSTQTLAQALVTVAKYAANFKKDKLRAEITLPDGSVQKIEYDQPIYSLSLPTTSSGNSIKVLNTSQADMYVKLIVSGQDDPINIGSLNARNTHINIGVQYKTLDGSPLDVSSLTQGTDFIAEVKVSNLNTRGTLLKNLALTHIIPSGWEIRSGRLNQVDAGIKEDQFEYRDIRDDRIHTFFDLSGTKTFRVMLNAAYGGQYYLPPVRVEAMYDHSIQASSKANKITVLPSL